MTKRGFPAPARTRRALPIRRRLYQSDASRLVAAARRRTPVLFNSDLTIYPREPDRDDDAYFANGDATSCVLHEGSARLESSCGCST